MNAIKELLDRIKNSKKNLKRVDDQQLTKYYSYYNYESNKQVYHYLIKSLYAKSYQDTPFVMEIGLNQGKLTMKIDATVEMPMDFLVYVGAFFDNYSSREGLVWTNKKELIIDFFNFGIRKYNILGGQVLFDFNNEDIKYLVKILLNDCSDDPKLFDRLCDKFYRLRKMSWKDYLEETSKSLEVLRKQERVSEITCMDLPLDWNNVFSNSEETKGVYAENSNDGLVLSLSNLGKVDIEYIAEITGNTCKQVIMDLKGSIYQNPATWNECFYKGWETADEYLSGLVLEKLRIAEEANSMYLGYFQDNVEALEKVKPALINSSDIYVTLGSPWVPTDIIDAFILHIFGNWNNFYSSATRTYIFNTKYDEISGTWEIPHKDRYFTNFSNDNLYGTKRMKGIVLLEKTLNMKTPTVTDEIVVNGKKKRILNKEETLLIREKQQKLIKAFKDWVFQDPDRRKRLVRIYEDKYCSNIVRNYDGSFLRFPQMNPNISLYDYQKNAVARIMFSPNTLLAHDVGAGKTYVMIASGMEMRRIGTSKKNLYVVPNNLVAQWKNIFLNIYPNAKVLAIEPRSFTPNKRIKVLEDIRDNDYDGIIIAYSCFSLIPLSKRFYTDKLEKQIEIIGKRMIKTNKSNKELIKKRKQLQEELLELKGLLNLKDDWVYFDELGINTMYVDEAHNFKNVPVETKINNVLGISTNGSKKCVDMMDKVHTVQKQNDGRGIVLATGTPITNSLVDMYVMQKYLQDGELSLLNIQSFDSWVGMFAEKDTNFEIDVDTSNYRMVTRFTKYHNMPELSTILSSITDFHQVDRNTGIPKLDGYENVIVKKTPEFNKYLEEISIRADKIRSGKISRTEDNMLKITTDGRKAALDIRLVDDSLGFTFDSKVAHCAENIYMIYQKTKNNKSTQLVFCDTSTPKVGFNLYDELRKLLITMGIKAYEIAYIHDAVTDAERDTLFKKVQKGEIRILIGSTMKLGLGVNVQDKLVALHHLDVPWRPADMIQREGRILRKGNENDEVQIYRYITEGSFDAYSWQLLESKQRVIKNILSGTMTKRMCEDVDDTVLKYAEVKAIAVGNPLLKERVELANELTKHYTLQRKYIETRQLLEAELDELPNRIEEQTIKLENALQDINFYEANKREYSTEERMDIRLLLASEINSEEIKSTSDAICQYQGFDIIVPNNMIKDKPYIFIRRFGKYYVELGAKDVGYMIRIDNFLEDLPKYAIKLEDYLNKLIKRKSDIEEELSKDNSYIDIINDLEIRLNKVDERLGVYK